MIETAGLTHLQILISDLERSLRFYREVFGMQEQFRAGPDLVFLSTPGSRDLVTLHVNRDAARASRIGKMGGVNHFGFRLLDASKLDEAVQAAEGAGGKLIHRGEHMPGFPFAYVADPDGYVLELLPMLS
jgi:catechol 2,3-dioxygenase-like lactoylglutathione lyase family enzyme